MINLVIVYRQLLIFKLICWLLIFFLMENFSMRYHIGLGHPLLKGCVGKCPFGWLLLILSFGGFSYGLGRVYKCNNFYLFLFSFFSFFFLIGKQLLSYSFTNTTCSPNIYKINKNVVPGYCNRNYQIIKKKKKKLLAK